MNTPASLSPAPRANDQQAETIAFDIQQARGEIIDFAQRMTTAGNVTVTSPTHPDLVERRLAVHDTEAPGYTVVFITVSDGTPDVTSMNFDINDYRALRHAVHEDGLGMTMIDPTNRPLVEYRIG